MSEGLDLEQDPVFDKSIILDSIQLSDPILIDNKLGDTNKGVPGRLLGKHHFYTEIGANSYICDTIEFGYKLVFLDSIPPPRFFKQNNKSALSRSDVVFAECQRLEQLGCLRRVDFVPHIVNPVSCVYSKKWRCVLDASLGLNPWCQSRKITLDDLTSLHRVLRQGDFMTVSDLDSGYWHVPIHPDFQTFLGLHFVLPTGQTLYWVWTCMPLGIIDAAFIFTKLTKPIMAHLRLQGKRSSIYIDDLFNSHQTFNGCAKQEEFIHTQFGRGGWVFKPEKSSGPPSQSVKYLGLMVNSVPMTFSIPDTKYELIVSDTVKFLNSKRFIVRDLASWVGKLQSLRLAIGPIISIMCKSLYKIISLAPFWTSYIKLDKYSVYEVEWWRDNLKHFSSYPIIIDNTSVHVDCKISSDASGSGYFVVNLDKSIMLKSEAFTQFESLQSSTYRELRALYQTYTDPIILSKFAGLTLCHYTDSKSVANILYKGSRVHLLNVMIREIFLALRHHVIKLVTYWVSRENQYIKMADLGSRENRSDDYSLSSDCLKSVLKNFPKVTFDAMASSTNTICEKFYSKLPSLNSCGVDIFSQSLDCAQFFFVFPPVSLGLQVLRFLESQKCKGLFIIPLWPTSNWFNAFFYDGRHCYNWVRKLLVFSPNFKVNLNNPSCFAEFVTFSCAALQFDFSVVKLGERVVTSRDLCLLGGCDMC